jgi:CheY-like chemotaxis protein
LLGAPFAVGYVMGEQTAGSSRARRRILVVDDDRLVRRSIERMLSTSFGVRGVASTNEAFDLLDAGERFDLVLCDMYLADSLDGRDFYERALARYPGLAARLVLMSGASPPDDQFGHAIGRRWIMKPFKTEELLALLARLGERWIDLAA